MLLQALEIKQQVLDVLIAFVSVLAQGLRDNAFQLRRNVARITSKWRRLFVAQDGRQDFVCIRAVERQAARDHLVNQNTETEYICARIHLKPARLLRRHVDRRAHNHPRFSLDGRACRRLRINCFWRHSLT